MNVDRSPEWQCERDRRISPRGARRPSIPGLRGRPESEEGPTTLAAFNRRCRCIFAAFAERTRSGRGPTLFYAGRSENHEGMKIARVTTAGARPGAFVFDHDAGTATARPPQPFSGHATFERRPHGRDLWHSTIRVPLLGSDHLSFRGHSFRAILVRDLPGD